jgi:tetratricopeptide (TPR) repeat protein
MKRARAGDLEGAVRLYDEAILTADDLLALQNRACAHFHLGDWGRAERDASWALEVDPEQARVYLVRGLARSRLKDLAGAKADLERYLALDPPSHRGLGEQALRRVERALAA